MLVALRTPAFSVSSAWNTLHLTCMRLTPGIITQGTNSGGDWPGKAIISSLPHLFCLTPVCFLAPSLSENTLVCHLFLPGMRLLWGRTFVCLLSFHHPAQGLESKIPVQWCLHASPPSLIPGSSGLFQGPFVHIASICAAVLSKFMSMFCGVYEVRVRHYSTAGAGW